MAHKETHSTSSLLYPTLITQIMQTVKVPFKVAPKGCKDGKAMGMKLSVRWISLRRQ